MHWNGLTQSSVTTFPIAGPWHCGRWQDHIGRVLGLLQRHLRLHRPGRLFWPDGQECVETLNCWMLLPRYSCLWNHASRRNQLLLSNIVKSVAHQWTPHIMIINRNYSARKNEVYCAVECIMEYDKYTWELEYVNIWSLICSSGGLHFHIFLKSLHLSKVQHWSLEHAFSDHKVAALPTNLQTSFPFIVLLMFWNLWLTIDAIHCCLHNLLQT